MQHQEEGRRVLDAVLEKLADAGKVERPPRMDGRKMTVLLMPSKPARAQSKPRPTEKAQETPTA
jgi:translation initiation factor IF-3